MMAEIPSIPIGAGHTITGKVSWFGGPNDKEAGQGTASGLSTKVPGIAIYDRATLGGYWRVRANNGRTAIVKQTDLGPAPWTGRKIDVTYSALRHFGYNEGNFPTNSTFQATYLGRNLPHGVRPGPTATAAGINIPGVTTETTTRTPGTRNFNKEGFEKARQESQAMKLLLKAGGVKGLGEAFPGPKLSEFVQHTPATSSTEVSQAGASTIPGAASSGRVPKGLPFLPGAEIKRIDQGQDLQAKPGQSLVAPGDGEVIAVKSDPTGFGPDYPVIRFTSGPMAGKSIYLGHTDTALRQGQKFRAGDTIARTSRTGHNAPPGWAEIGEASALGSGNMSAGRSIAPYFRRK